MPYKQTLEEGLKEVEKFIFAVRYKQGETEIVDFDYHAKEREMLKSFLSTFAEKIRESVVEETLEKIEEIKFAFTPPYQETEQIYIEQHIRIVKTLDDLLAQLKDK